MDILVVDGEAREMWETAPDFHPDLLVIRNYDGEVELGWLWDGTTFSAPAVIDEFDTDLPYDVKRANDYPSIGDQLDDLFRAGYFSDDMAAQIQAVKNKHPKG